MSLHIESGFPVNFVVADFKLIGNLPLYKLDC